MSTFFTELSHADRSKIIMKHIKRDLDQRHWSDPLGGLRGRGQKLKIQLLPNMVMLHIKLKGITNAATW